MKVLLKRERVLIEHDKFGHHGPKKFTITSLMDTDVDGRVFKDAIYLLVV